MSLSQEELKDLIGCCQGSGIDRAGTFNAGVAGKAGGVQVPVRIHYKGSGNWDVYLDGKYVGTAWYS
jgi:hypothetical protein